MFNFVSKRCLHFSPRCPISTSSRVSLKVYTRSGDKGTSSTFSGERRNKDDAIFEALGTTDELSCAIGLARAFLPETCENIDLQLEEVQCIIQDLSSAVATPKSSSTERQIEKTKFPEEHVDALEKWIDDHTKNLPPLKNFILPSGGPSAAALHKARSVCRRAERRVVPLVRQDEVDEAPIRYLNRLSDYLFTVARVAGISSGQKEFIYTQPKFKTPRKYSNDTDSN